MLERPGNGTAAIVVALDLGEPDYLESLEEMQLLARSGGVDVLAVVRGRRDRPDPALYAGKGKVQEIELAVAEHRATVVIFNHALSPIQERNLERQLNCRVIDRTSLILDIFAQRARSHEGKLQVELAQLEHLSTRLVRGWTHLERQRGGIGMRGPGETQLETDRRLLGKRVKLLREKLSLVRAQHATQRRSRSRAHVFSVSLVGYTNAGKSTLFNRLAKADAYAADQLFATLDTTTRRLSGIRGAAVVISDTVGFIRHLPHTLVDAFQATLEETIKANLLLHIVDAGSPDRDLQIAAVNQVLSEIGANQVPQIMVFNKIDRTQVEPRMERDEYGRISRLWLSALTGDGIVNLRDAIQEYALNSIDPGQPAAA